MRKKALRAGTEAEGDGKTLCINGGSDQQPGELSKVAGPVTRQSTEIKVRTPRRGLVRATRVSLDPSRGHTTLLALPEPPGRARDPGQPQTGLVVLECTYSGRHCRA